MASPGWPEWTQVTSATPLWEPLHTWVLDMSDGSASTQTLSPRVQVKPPASHPAVSGWQNKGIRQCQGYTERQGSSAWTLSFRRCLGNRAG